MAAEYRLDSGDRRLHDWWEEVLRLLRAPDLARLMRPSPSHTVYNEVPVQYRRGEQTVFGIIDRLVVGDDRVWVIDYKSHRLADATEQQRLVQHYRPQMLLYREAVQKLWPDRGVRCYLLFTASAGAVEVD